MSFSRFFISRPIFSAVISITIVIAGLMAARGLPIAQYPQIAPPTVIISANYPGASAETLTRTVAGPIEEQLSGVENLLFFNSSAQSNGALVITATFEVGTNVDTATVNVNNRVKIAEPRLPEIVRQFGVTVQKRSNDILLVTAITSPTEEFSNLYLSNYALVNIVDELKRLPGVGDAQILGAKDYSMRIWLKPDRMAQLGMTAVDVAAAIAAQNKQNVAGKIGQEPAPLGQQLVYTVTAKGRLVTPEQFGDIVIRSVNGFSVKLRDVAQVREGAASDRSNVRLNGQSAISAGVIRQATANPLELSAGVREMIPKLKADLPSDMVINVANDNSVFIDRSIKSVFKTIVEAVVLVALVIFVFLRTIRASIIPIITIPVSLIGAFAMMALAGFTINTLTLLALVLAIGLVVDDAIVVLENTERLMREENLKRPVRNL
jgi:HAE1 family hydrophobic/amphiphilic exporter-1/multidrug efflux pump